MPSEQDFKGRELHFIAIGGAGMSALALATHSLGAAVTGSDRAESSYLQRLRDAGLNPRVGHDADAVPPGADIVVSTAISDDNPELARARERGQRVMHRGELLADLCATKRLLAVAGTHGKTTTAAMAAWALRELGADPAFLLGGELIGAGPDGDATNAGWGAGEWIVAEADESDASFLKLRPEVAVITNVELDHHSRWGSRAELIEAFTRFAAPAAGLVLPADSLAGPGRTLGLDALAGGSAGCMRFARCLRFDSAEPGPELSLQVPGRHNLLNARAALSGLELAGFPTADVGAALAGFPGVRRRLEPKGSVNGARVYDDYAHHPTEVAAALAAVRELEPQRLFAVFQPHLYSRTKAMAREFGAALASADEIGVLEVYPAREQPVGELAGVTGRWVAEAAAESSAGRPVWWLNDPESALRMLRPRLDTGDVVVTLGAGDIGERLAEALVAEGDNKRRRILRSASGSARSHLHEMSRPDGVEADYSLARLTTVRAGGPADFFSGADSDPRLLELLRWADAEGLPVEVVGSGSNLLVADAGVRGLVLKLEGELAALSRDGERLLAGGGARLPSVAAKAAGWGLAGLEFGINIPGTVGGAVRMNANAYGGELAKCLEWVEISSASGVERRAPDDLGFTYRNSNLITGEVVARASFALHEGEPASIKAVMEGMRQRRRDAQPSGIKTFGSTFVNPDDPRAGGQTAGQLLEAAGCRGLQVGGARFSEKHANFVENMGEARTADILELMAEGRRRVHESFGVVLEPEVQVLGTVEWPDAWDLVG